VSGPDSSSSTEKAFKLWFTSGTIGAGTKGIGVDIGLGEGDATNRSRTTLHQLADVLDTC